MNEHTVDPGRDTDKFSDQLARKEPEFAVAFPRREDGITPLVVAERFVRALLTTVSMNPRLLRADRRSFWDASSRAALDGLLPDGKEAALVPFENRRKINGQWATVLTVIYIPMIGGYRRLVREAGIDWQLRVVHQKDKFEHQQGDEESIFHIPSQEDDPGPWVYVYAIAKERRSGEIIARDVMNRAAVFRIRDRSQGWQAMQRIEDEQERKRAIAKSAWGTWEEEMALKTVAKRQVKVLPLSTDSYIYDVIRREDDEAAGKKVRTSIASTGSLSEKMRALADQREAEAQAEEDDGVDDIDDDGVVIDKTEPAAALQPAAAAAPEAAQPSSSSQKAVSAEPSGATQTAEPEPPEVPPDEAQTAAPAGAAPAPKATAPAGTVMKLTSEQAQRIRQFAGMLSNAQSERTVTKGAVNFLEDEGYAEGSEAEAAVVAIRDVNILRVRDKASSTDCDKVRDRVTKL